MVNFDIKKKVRMSGGLLADIVLGGQDGVVNVLGITLAIATATSSNKVVIIAAFAALFAESISMAAVAYTSKKALLDYRKSMIAHEKWEIKNIPAKEAQEIKEIYYKKGFRGNLLSRIVKTIVAKKKLWLNVMLTDELGLAKSDRTSPVKAALIVGFASVVGSFIPIIPFLFLPVKLSMYLSVAMCCIILFFAGAFKAKVTIGSWKKEGIEMVIVGLVAAIAGYVVGYLLGKL